MSDLTTKAAEIRAGLVKPLVWLDGRDATTVFSVVQVAKILGCEGLAGLDYSIIGPYRNGLYEVVLGEKIVATLGSENEAKARAQSDYEARLLSALNLSGIEQQAAELAEARERAAADAIKRIAEIADAVGWQAGVGASETAGLIVSVLAANPEHVARFMNAGSELFIDGTMRAENGCLSHLAMNGEVISPTKLRSTKGTSQ